MPSPSSSSSSSSSKEGSQRRSWRWKTLLISAQRRRPLKTNWKGCSHLSLPSRRPWCSLTPNSLAEARSSFCHRPSSGRHRSCWWHSGWSPNPKCSVFFHTRHNIEIIWVFLQIRDHWLWKEPLYLKSGTNDKVDLSQACKNISVLKNLPQRT